MTAPDADPPHLEPGGHPRWDRHERLGDWRSASAWAGRRMTSRTTASTRCSHGCLAGIGFPTSLTSIVNARAKRRPDRRLLPKNVGFRPARPRDRTPPGCRFDRRTWPRSRSPLTGDCWASRRINSAADGERRSPRASSPRRSGATSQVARRTPSRRSALRLLAGRTLAGCDRWSVPGGDRSSAQQSERRGRITR